MLFLSDVACFSCANLLFAVVLISSFRIFFISRHTHCLPGRGVLTHRSQRMIALRLIKNCWSKGQRRVRRPRCPHASTTRTSRYVISLHVSSNICSELEMGLMLALHIFVSEKWVVNLLWVKGSWQSSEKLVSSSLWYLLVFFCSYIYQYVKLHS